MEFTTHYSRNLGFSYYLDSQNTVFLDEAGFKALIGVKPRYVDDWLSRRTRTVLRGQKGKGYAGITLYPLQTAVSCMKELNPVKASQLINELGGL